MKKKKIAVLGRGTAGVLTMAQLLGSNFNEEKSDIEWYFDSNTKPQAVGEGSTLAVPRTLFKNIGFTHSDLEYIDGTFKHGIEKRNWGENKNFTHEFNPPGVGYHFNAVKLQELLFERLSNRIKIIDTNITSDQIDADFTFDCSGTPSDEELIETAKYIPVNAAYVTQCFWDAPRFFKTLTIARPYGWVFGIPLRNRCSIGYMFNDTINSLEDVKEDVKSIFEEFNLVPSTTTNELHFKNYYRKKNFGKNVVYNGNASFFLEPLEATTLSVAISINDLALNLLANPLEIHKCNSYYNKRMTKTERIIMFHYFAGSRFKTDFWEFAEERGRRCMEEAVQDKNWLIRYELSKKTDFKDPHSLQEESQNLGYEEAGGEDWQEWSYYCNLSSMGLNIYDKIDKLKKS